MTLPVTHVGRLKHKARVQLPPNLTLDRIIEAVGRSHVTLDDPGFCLACGASAEGVEPDAVNYECESCGSMRVYGAEELLLIFT